MSLVVVMGSGETTPTMVRTHREIFAVTGPGPAVMLDTPFGFQSNADELTARTQAYFADSVGRGVEVARWRRADAPVVAREQSLAALAQSRWAFAGPGSPTYALRQWRDTAVPGAMVDVVERGGTLVVGSAAACAVGTHAIPVYEIYKVGAEPVWVPGLDLLGRLAGLTAALVPHYDNREGGTHDTRFCYLGEERLRALEAELPAEVGVLGVDEHTALLLDLDRRVARVAGHGVVTVRRRGASRTFAGGAEVPLGDLAAMLRGEAGGRDETVTTGPPGRTGGDVPASGSTAPPVSDPSPATSLAAEADLARVAFEAALAARDVDGCVAAVLALEQALHDWRGDSLQGPDTDTARRTLRSMLVRLGELARVGARDPRTVLGPLIEVLLELRARARGARDFATSDLVRDRLAASGIEVRDTPAGVAWEVRPS